MNIQEENKRLSELKEERQEQINMIMHFEEKMTIQLDYIKSINCQKKIKTKDKIKEYAIRDSYKLRLIWTEEKIKEINNKILWLEIKIQTN